MKSVFKKEARINQNVQNYTTKIHDPVFNDVVIFALKNNLFLLHDISKAFPYFNLLNSLIKKTNKITFLLPVYTMIVYGSRCYNGAVSELKRPLIWKNYLY